MIIFEITRDSYASTSLSLSLSLSLSTTCFQSLQIVWSQKISEPNQGQTGIPRINHASKRPTLRPMPRKKIIEPWHEISNNVVCGTSKASDQPAHMIRAFASHLNMLLTEHRLEFVSLKGGCTGSSECTLVKMPYCWKSHVAA